MKKKGNNMFKEYTGYVVGALVFFGLITAISSCTTVHPGERGIYMFLGQASNVVLTEGAHFKLPFVSTIKKVSIRIQKSQSTAEAATKDLQKVKTVLALNWNLSPTQVVDMYRSVGDENDIENRIINPAVSEVLKAATAKLTAEEVLTKRLQLKANIDELLIERLAKYNVLVTDVSLVDLEFTEEFNHAVENKQISEQKAKQAEYIAQQAKADAQAEINKAQGQAQAQKLIQQTVTKDILYLEYLKKWNGVLPTVMSGSNSGLMLNLQQGK